MKNTVTSVIATLMLLGLLSAAAMPKSTKNNLPVTVASGPMPTCYPTDPGCGPVIPGGVR